MGRTRKEIVDRIATMVSEGYTLKEVSEKLDVSPTTVRRYSNGVGADDSSPESKIERCPEVIEARKRLVLAELERKVNEIAYPEEYLTRVDDLEKRTRDIEDLLAGIIERGTI